MKLIFGLIVLILAFSAKAMNITTVHHQTPAWSALTNEDGTGLYHDIFNEIFAVSGVKVNVIYTPLLRAMSDVKKGKADMMGGIARKDPDFIYALNPVYQSRVSALFHKKHLPAWTGLETFKKHPNQSVGSVGVGKLINVQVHEVNNRMQALNMLLHQRKTYYVDATELFESLYQGSYTKHFESGNQQLSLMKFDKAQYTYRTVSDVSAYMVFNKNERGEAIKALFDHGFHTLYESGRLLEIYKKWGFERVISKQLLN